MYEKPRADESKTAVLPVEAIVIGVEGKVIQEEEAKPVSLTDGRVAAHGVILIGQPHDQYDVEGGGGVIKEFRHDGLHSNERQYDGEKRRSRKRHRYV